MATLLNRIEFLRSLGRGALLVGLTGVGIEAVRGTKDVSECFNHNSCASCWGFHDCSLPEKKEAKDHERSEEIRPA